MISDTESTNMNAEAELNSPLVCYNYDTYSDVDYKNVVPLLIILLSLYYYHYPSFSQYS